MKRVRVSPGKFVVVSTAMADKAARIFASGAFTRDQIRDAAAAEPHRPSSRVMLGRPSQGGTQRQWAPAKDSSSVVRGRRCVGA